MLFGISKNTALHYAIWNGSIDVAKVSELRNKCKDFNSLQHYDTNSKTQVLLLNGANMNAVTKFHATPLEFATLRNRIDCTRLLLCFGK